MAVGIPKKLGHIWIGPHPAPTEWMRSWQEAHPDWEYTVFDNEYLLSRTFRNQPLINEYFARRMYPGVSDLMRYEILLEQGGFLPEADSVCVHGCDGLFTEETAYTVYEKPGGQYGFVSPILASVPGHPFLETIISTLEQVEPEQLNRPWNSVGNGFLKRLIRKTRPEIHIFPSHYFIPEGKDGERYEGTDQVYADQFWGSTTLSYPHSRGRGAMTEDQVDRAHFQILDQLKLKTGVV